MNEDTPYWFVYAKLPGESRAHVLAVFRHEQHAESYAAGQVGNYAQVTLEKKTHPGSTFMQAIASEREYVNIDLPRVYDDVNW